MFIVNFSEFNDGSDDCNDSTDRFGLKRAFNWLLICILVKLFDDLDISCENRAPEPNFKLLVTF